MDKINLDGKQLAQNKSVGNIKIWKKPILAQLDIKQTLIVDCGSGMHWDSEARDCRPD